MNQGSNEAENEFINKHSYISTPLGTVVKMPFSEPVPAGWRRLRIDEGRQIKDFLNQIIGEWSIVAFETGKLDGPGYGNKIHEDFGGECGEGFVIKMQNENEFINKHPHISTPLGTVVKMPSSGQVPPGWRRLKADEGKQIKGFLNQILDQWSIVGFETGKIDGTGYGNKIHEDFGDECGERFVIKMQ